MKKLKRKLTLWRMALVRQWEMFKHYKLNPLIEKLKLSKLGKYLETANWFKWYGRKLVYMAPKSDADLNVFEAKIKVCIIEKDYQGALNIVNSIPDQSAPLIAIKTMLEGKVK
jgi:hypothetical protein